MNNDAEWWWISPQNQQLKPAKKIRKDNQPFTFEVRDVCFLETLPSREASAFFPQEAGHSPSQDPPYMDFPSIGVEHYQTTMTWRWNGYPNKV